MHHVGLEQPGAEAEENRDRDVLHEIAGTPVDLTAVTALVERAQRDADQRYRRGEPSPTGLSAHRPIMQDQHDAGEPEQQSAPLQRRDAFAEPAASQASRSGSAADPESSAESPAGIECAIAIAVPPR